MSCDQFLCVKLYFLDARGLNRAGIGRDVVMPETWLLSTMVRTHTSDLQAAECLVTCFCTLTPIVSHGAKG